MIPLRDDNPSSSPPIITVTLIAINVLIFLITWIPGYVHYTQAVFTYGMIPAELLRGQSVTLLPPEFFPEGVGSVEIRAIPPIVTLFTSMFLHGGFMHLIMNMWFLWLFGDNIEDRMGIFRFIVFYLVTGLVAGLAHALVASSSFIPTIGASGAISGVIGAYLVLYPRANILTLIIFFIITTARIPAFIFLGLWFIGQVFSGVGSFGDEGAGVAFFAHIGGFLAGAILVKLFAKRQLVQVPKTFEEDMWSAYNDDENYEDHWY